MAVILMWHLLRQYFELPSLSLNFCVNEVEKVYLIVHSYFLKEEQLSLQKTANLFSRIQSIIIIFGTFVLLNLL